MIYVVVPAYNEEHNILRLLSGIKDVAQRINAEYKVIVVNDGSTDATPRIIEEYSGEYNIIPIHNIPNMGLGRTMAKGLKKASELSIDDDFIVTLDGDATHDPVYIPDMINKINQGYDVVIASRFAPGGFERGLSLFRKVLSRGSGLLLSLTFPSKDIRDYTCGFRLFRASIIRKGFFSFGDSFVSEKGFTVTPEILLKVRSLKANISEVGFELKYDLKEGNSKMKITRTVIQSLALIVKLKLMRL